jgi:hypothetical protein
MAVIKFPNKPESNHPQYLWNEQEYVLRMLMQNHLCVGLDEAADQVTVSLNTGVSLNTLAHGSADFRHNNIAGVFDTNATRWIYFRADGTEFYISGLQPEYNQYLHGWYHPTEADRAVVFIDSDQPAGYRCSLMDSANSMVELNYRIPNIGGTLVYYKGYGSPIDSNGGSFSYLLQPGKYRIELKAGRGGNGGAGISRIIDPRYMAGGSGAEGQSITYKITVVSNITISGNVGWNGAHGTDANVNDPQFISLSSYYLVTSGGGGSSGEDSYIQVGDYLIVEAIGGAGGGGSGFESRVFLFGAHYSSGAGGGGSGFGTAYDGQSGNGEGIQGYAGALNNGGAGGNSQQGNGNAGQNRGSLRRRNGGSSPRFTISVSGNNWSIQAANGGMSVLNSTNGYVRIYKTGDIAEYAA